MMLSLEEQFHKIIREELEEPIKLLKSLIEIMEIEYGKKLIFCPFCNIEHIIYWDKSKPQSIEARVIHAVNDNYCARFSAVYASSTAEAYQRLTISLKNLWLGENSSKNGERK